jgi:tRNA(Arg) A34 adenosine deaminase TadA
MSELHQKWIREAIMVAAGAREHGNHPFGAILVADDTVVLRCENTVNTSSNPTKHAERNLIDAALERFSPDELGEMTLYSSAEPCVMCAGMMYWAGIRSLAYSCSALRFDELFGETFVIPSHELFTHAHPPISSTGPILEEEGLEVHKDFWDGSEF